MIIAIWGESATAKTTVATQLASRLDLPLRSCGNEIRLATKAANVPLDKASEALHRTVDTATCEWARQNASIGAVIEGRFLDQVLAETPEVVFVQATCNRNIRLERWKGRAGEGFDSASLTELDKTDDLFRRVMYGSSDTGVANVTLDTSSGEVNQWVTELLSYIIQSGIPVHD